MTLSLGGGGFALFSTPTATTFALPPLTSTAATAVTGTQTDTQFTSQLIGKDIPLFIGGQALMGCRIIEGPFVYTSGTDNLVDMIVSPAAMATPGATRTIGYLNLNGTTSADSSDGGVSWTPRGTALAGLEINVRTGTEDQLPFASSIARYGAKAVPYRSHFCVEIKKIPLSLFGNNVPFVSVPIHESDSISRNDALAKLFGFVRYAPDEMEFNVLGSDAFWIAIKPGTALQYAQDLRRIFRTWNITMTDRLRIFETNSARDAIALSRSDIVADSIGLTRLDPLSIPAQRSYTFIDTGRDNDMNTVKATRVRFPVPVTSSASTETVELPIGTTDVQAKADVDRSLLIDDIARTQLSCTVMPWMRGLQAGDVISFDDDPSISFLGRIISVARKAADWTADIQAEKIDYFTLNIRPQITSNGGGATASITIDEATTAVTTVTATDADFDPLTYAISGGADAALFTINATTGVLAFITAPEYGAPADADSNNIYEVTVHVSDGSLTDTQAISVTVAFVSTAPPATPLGLLLGLTRHI